MLVYVRPQPKYSKSKKSTPQEIKTKAISLMFPFTRLLILQLSKSCIGGIFYVFTAHRTTYYFRIYPDLNNAIYGVPVVCILSNVPCTTFNHLTMHDKVGKYGILLVFSLLQECTFNKLASDTSLKVSFQANMRVNGNNRCNRWYFKFNGNECGGPMTIEARVYNNWPSGNINHNQLHHRSFEGYCENIPQGAVRVELWVGQCTGETLGNAYTGWNSVSRIMIEEVSRPQS